MGGEKQQGGNTDSSWQRTDHNDLEHFDDMSPVPRPEELGRSDPRFPGETVKAERDDYFIALGRRFEDLVGIEDIL
jgi:hypothetical protein